MGKSEFEQLMADRPVDAVGEAIGGRRARLALVVPSLEIRGGVQTVARFIKDVALRSGRYQLVLISLAEGSADPQGVRLLAPRTWWRGVTHRRGTWEGLPFDHVGAWASELEFQRMRPRRELTRLLADCDIVQVVSGSPALANVVNGLGKPWSVQCATRVRLERRQRDATATGWRGIWRRLMTPITERIEDRVLRQADAVQVENPSMFDYARLLGRERGVDVRYAPPGIDARWYRPDDECRLAKAPYVLTVSRLDDPRKNLGLLLDAFAAVEPARRAGVKLVFAGAATPPPAFWQRVDALGLRESVRVVQRPPATELLRLYQQARVFALPSDEEGLGMVLLEAMACGVPVISTRSGGPEGILTDGVEGHLVPVGDGQAFARALDRLLADADLNRDMGRRARQRIEETYEERVAGEPFLEVWRMLARKAGIAFERSSSHEDVS